MRLLLDTHALLWYVVNDAKLSATAQALIVDAKNEILISPASYWEIAIKVSIGKLVLHQPLEDLVDLCVHRYGFDILPIAPSDAAQLAALPYPPNHKDPFDRMLVAQAVVEQIPIISDDQHLDAYPITRLWN